MKYKTQKTKYKRANNPNFGNHKLAGKNHWNYIDGRKLIKHYCVEIDCNNRISYNNWKYGQGRCQSCASKRTWQISDKIKNRNYLDKNNPNYVDGRSNKPYPLEFNDKLKFKIRKRDNYTCQKCGITEEEHLIVYGKVLSIHHIDYNKQNCEETNLTTLCNECNNRVNFNRKYWNKFFKDMYGHNLHSKKFFPKGEEKIVKIVKGGQKI